MDFDLFDFEIALKLTAMILKRNYTVREVLMKIKVAIEICQLWRTVFSVLFNLLRLSFAVLLVGEWFWSSCLDLNFVRSVWHPMQHIFTRCPSIKLYLVLFLSFIICSTELHNMSIGLPLITVIFIPDGTIPCVNKHFIYLSS